MGRNTYMCVFARMVFLHQTRGKRQIHVRTQRWGIQKCDHSFPQAHAGSQKMVSSDQLTPTHKMASMRLYGNSETLPARGSEKQSPPKMLKKVLGRLRHCPFCFFLPREKYEQNNGNASNYIQKEMCERTGCSYSFVSTPTENGSLLRAGIHQVCLLYQPHAYFYSIRVKNMPIITRDMMPILSLLCSACKSWNWKHTVERVSTLEAKKPDTKLWSSYDQYKKIDEIWEIIDKESVVDGDSFK